MLPDLVASAWPLIATMAVLGGTRVRAARRRLALNRALHELRRPLQALALVSGAGFRRGSDAAPGPLDMALVALDDLERAVNGAQPARARRPVSARALVSPALERWRGVAAKRGRSLSLEWRAGSAVVMADPPRIAQALDNLLANAIEHGGLRIRVEASICSGGVRIAVAGGGVARAPRSHDPRRGHGLEVVKRVALAHDGRFELLEGARGVVAVLELPLAPVPLPAVPIEWASGRPSQSPGRRRTSRPGGPAVREPASPRAA